MTSVIVLAARDAIAHHLHKLPNVRVLVVDDPPALKLDCLTCEGSEHLIAITPKMLGNVDRLARQAKREVDHWLPNHLHQGKAGTPEERSEEGVDRERPRPSSDPVLRALVPFYGPAGALARREQLRSVVAGIEERLRPGGAVGWNELRYRVGVVLAGTLVEEHMARVAGSAA